MQHGGGLWLSMYKSRGSTPSTTATNQEKSDSIHQINKKLQHSVRIWKATLKKHVFVYVCLLSVCLSICVSVYMYVHMLVLLPRGAGGMPCFVGVTSLLLVCGFWSLNSCYQDWSHAPLPAEPNGSPQQYFLNIVGWNRNWLDNVILEDNFAGIVV